jgi:hypothetical protein
MRWSQLHTLVALVLIVRKKWTIRGILVKKNAAGAEAVKITR